MHLQTKTSANLLKVCNLRSIKNDMMSLYITEKFILFVQAEDRKTGINYYQQNQPNDY